MKNLLLAVVLVLFTGCISRPTPTDEPKVLPSRCYEFVVIEHDGEKHIYIRTLGSTGGLAHWEGCKYCKIKDNEN